MENGKIRVVRNQINIPNNVPGIAERIEQH